MTCKAAVMLFPRKQLAIAQQLESLTLAKRAGSERVVRDNGRLGRGHKELFPGST